MLWVDFQVAEICLQVSDRSIRAVLEHLPRGLPETFDRLLKRITMQKRQNLVHKIFQWLSCAKRQLTLQEISEAIVIEPCQSYLSKDQSINDITGVPSWCCGLVIRDEQDDTIQFAHSTVKEFLLGDYTSPETDSFRITLKDANHYLGQICVTYLHLDNFKKSLRKAPKRMPVIDPQTIARTAGHGKFQENILQAMAKLTSSTKPASEHAAQTHTGYLLDNQLGNLHCAGPAAEAYSLFKYASRYWIYHTQDFSSQQDQLWMLWKQVLDSEIEVEIDPWVIKMYEARGQELAAFVHAQNHFALVEAIANSGRGFDDTSMHWLLKKSVVDHNVKLLKKLVQYCALSKVHQESCLLDAVQYQRVNCVRILHSEGLRNRHALVEAICGHNVEIVDIMIDENPCINERLVDDWTPLQELLTRRGSHVSPVLVEKLLSAGADVNAAPAPNTGRTALQAAVGSGQSEIVDVLLRAGAQVDAPAAVIEGLTAFQAAVLGGHANIIQQLLRSTARISETPREEIHKAFMVAVDDRRLDVLKSLVNAGADVNVAPKPTDIAGLTTLQYAAASGNLPMVEELLARGANVNAKPRPFGFTAIQAAARYGREDIVKILIAARAEVNAPPAICGLSAFEAATHDVPVDKESAICWFSALQAAVLSGSLVVVELLLAAGANVNMKVSAGPLGRTALQAAAEAGRGDIIGQLLLKDVQIDDINPYHKQSALHFAAVNGHMDAMERLLQAGARGNAGRQPYISKVLVDARAAGHTEAADRLLTAGAQYEWKTSAWGVL